MAHGCKRYKMKNLYKVAGLCFAVSGERLCKVVKSIEGFAPFLTDRGDELFSFVEGNGVPGMGKVEYEFTHEGVVGAFGRTERGLLLIMKPHDDEALCLWHNDGEKEVFIGGNLHSGLCRYAMWVGLGLMFAPHGAVAVHGSCIVYREKAVLFLGESGTGKSTHTRLWQENVDGAFLLNDDSPFLRVEEDGVWAYGSPWSGKTPCYRQERYKLKGCVRLSQAPFNKIKKMPILQAYGAIHPSCPPAFANDDALYDNISDFIGCLLSLVPCFHLECLPNKEASLLSFQSIFVDEKK